MKKWLYMLLLALAAFLLPGKGTDVGELIPVELVRLTAGDGTFVAAADTGDFGTGATLEEAMADLASSAPGKVFLETADYLLLAPQTRESWEKLAGWFRPGTLIYGADEEIDPAAAAEFLRSHTGGVPLNRLEKTMDLEKLVLSEGRVKLEE